MHCSLSLKRCRAFGFRFRSWVWASAVLLGITLPGRADPPVPAKSPLSTPKTVGQEWRDPDETRPIQVTLQVLDADTVSARYGKRIGRDFFVLRAAIWNRLGRSEKDVSVLAYSDSMYVRVGLEKRKGNSLDDHDRDRDGSWTIAVHTDYAGAIVGDLPMFPALAPEPDPRDTQHVTLPERFHIQPVSFSDILKEAFDNKKGRLTDAQLLNIALDGIHPTEEIPFGISIERTLFFPRRPFLRPNTEYVFRIREFYTGYFHSMTPVVHSRSTGQRSSKGP